MKNTNSNNSNLTQKDYIKILEYYKKTIPKSKQLLEKEAESILSEKLCICIKKVGDEVKLKNEARAIGICTKSVFNKKGLTRGKFNCTGKRSVKINKTKKNRGNTGKLGK
jgi:hypothetical protein